MKKIKGKTEFYCHPIEDGKNEYTISEHGNVFKNDRQSSCDVDLRNWVILGQASELTSEQCKDLVYFKKTKSQYEGSGQDGFDYFYKDYMTKTFSYGNPIDSFTSLLKVNGLSYNTFLYRKNDYLVIIKK